MTTVKPWKRCPNPESSSSEIIEDGKVIRFHPCGVTSHHPQDVKNRYCAFCHSWIEKSWAPINGDECCYIVTCYQAWTDGACHDKPNGRGGYAYVMKSPDGSFSQSSGREINTNSNRMELTAALIAIRAVPIGETLIIYTDSRYVTNGAARREEIWLQNTRPTANKPMADSDLWQAIDNECAVRKVIWEWIKGHAGNVMNQVANEIASRRASGIFYSSLDHLNAKANKR